MHVPVKMSFEQQKKNYPNSLIDNESFIKKKRKKT